MDLSFSYLEPMTARIMAKELYHTFTVINGVRYRVMVIAKQRVQDQWMQIPQTELATFSPRNRRTLRMPQRPPPPPPSPVEEQPVNPPHVPSPEEVLAQPSQPTSDAPVPMRAERRHRSTPPLDLASHLWQKTAAASRLDGAGLGSRRQ
jgi:hypothetical protein